jgi:hypothetical protein
MFFSVSKTVIRRKADRGFKSLPLRSTELSPRRHRLHELLGDSDMNAGAYHTGDAQGSPFASAVPSSGSDDRPRDCAEILRVRHVARFTSQPESACANSPFVSPMSSSNATPHL